VISLEPKPPELVCDEKLNVVLNRLSLTDTATLRRLEVVEQLIQECGLVREKPEVYGEDEKYLNPIRRGLWQIPRQLAEFSIFLSTRKINSFLEIGTFSGGTFTFLMGYLNRFNPGLRGITIDTCDANPPVHLWKNWFDAQFIIASSREYVGQSFDLCLIDGWHSFFGVTWDYVNVGRHAKLCAFHDINDDIVEYWPGNDGGVPRFWRQFRALHREKHFHEFLYHTRGERVMGIGVIEQDNVGRNDYAQHTP
jgi:hypothetical protein